MSRKKIWIVILLLTAIVVGLLGAVAYQLQHYVLVGGEFYPRDLEVLDLRGQRLSVSAYRKLQKQLPDTVILWNVEFQGKSYDSDTTTLTVSALTDDDVAKLANFGKLQSLDARQCDDYTRLEAVREKYPQLEVLYDISLAGARYPYDAQKLELENVKLEELPLLIHFPRLEEVTLVSAESEDTAMALRNYCRDQGIGFRVVLGEKSYAEDTTEATVVGMREEQLLLLKLLPRLKSLMLKDPEVPAELLLQLRKDRPDLKLNWEVTLCGLTFSDDTEDVDLSEQVVASVEEVEHALTYLPRVKQVFLGFCGLDNEELAAYRERNRQQYKVVWVVDLSGKMKVRTDIDNFMPSRDGWGYVRDHEVDNIRYCEDLICIDLGHMGIKDVSFLETLVNLEYLILAHTEVQYIEPIVNCQKLRYLELDWSCIRDISPLVELKALEDLNLGMTWPDITPLLQMTWLKNLYLIKGNCKANFAEALPNTRVVTSGDYTVSNGWRNLPNYYAMRDILGMYYM